MDPLALLQELVSIPGPPGGEEPVAVAIQAHVKKLGLKSSLDAKGNVLVPLGKSSAPRVVVTAHMDEIAMIVVGINVDGSIRVAPLGGLFAWKLGEGPVQILTSTSPIDGVLSFGSIHTNDPSSNPRRAEKAAIGWEMASVFTGQSAGDLIQCGVRPGSRVVVHPSRRNLLNMGQFVSGHFLDDRSDLVAWLLALDELKNESLDVLFVASVSEEVGGHGALYALQGLRPEVCIALELGPFVDDAPVQISDQPTIWATDSYASMSGADGDILERLGLELGMQLQFQSLSRGGSDASCAASHGLCARPITIGIPMENSHGYEIIHPGAMANMARLTVALLRFLEKG